LTQIKSELVESQYEVSKLKSSIIISELNRINLENLKISKPCMNFIIVSMSILNILETSLYFKPVNMKKQDDCLYLAGHLGHYECYVDLTLDTNLILLRYDKGTSRDVKITSILEDSCNQTQIQLEVKGVY